MKTQRFKVTLRDKERLLLPKDIRFMKAQKKEHNVFSKDGHIWKKNDTCTMKTCEKCFALMSYDSWGKKWFPLICSMVFTTEDIQELIKINN